MIADTASPAGGGAPARSGSLREGITTRLSRQERRIAWVWALLLLNVLSYSTGPMVVHIPSKLGKVLTQGSLLLALLLALSANPKLRVRRSAFLGLFSVLAATSTMMSLRFVSVGTDYRAVRLLLFLGTLWLVTPWWGSDRMVLLRAQMATFSVAIASVVLGLILAHHRALSVGGRLSGTIWPMPPTQVAHYAAEISGITIILWMCKQTSRRRFLLTVPVALLVLLLSHTRTALLAMVIGLVVAGSSLLTSRRRVRRTFTAVLLVVALSAPIAASTVSAFLARGQSSQQLTQLTGRTKVWAALLADPRPETNKILGSGLSNKGFKGLPIDNGWLAVYQDQGVVGDVLVGFMILVLILSAAYAPRGPTKAVALFLITYCLVAAFTETGLGDASTYSMDLAMAASLLTVTATVPRGRRMLS